MPLPARPAVRRYTVAAQRRPAGHSASCSHYSAEERTPGGRLPTGHSPNQQFLLCKTLGRQGKPYPGAAQAQAAAQVDGHARRGI